MAKAIYKKVLLNTIKAKQKFIESAGIKFIRFTNNDVYANLSGVLESIAQNIRNLRG
ncbi:MULTISPECIES: endonuclease domain-containing protein [unclassified Nostoc]|uniref:endonuclease domain-containing protein n=1 Tax=unclassified Nostoc TaxID=2593658 RepID=UPI0021573180|nr:endonuclease domain-containing protein [Nostoc sp. 'Peltigera membranacea cyanobiont' N6]